MQESKSHIFHPLLSSNPDSTHSAAAQGIQALALRHLKMHVRLMVQNDIRPPRIKRMIKMLIILILLTLFLSESVYLSPSVSDSGSVYLSVSSCIPLSYSVFWLFPSLWLSFGRSVYLSVRPSFCHFVFVFLSLYFCFSLSVSLFICLTIFFYLTVNLSESVLQSESLNLSASLCPSACHYFFLFLWRQFYLSIYFLSLRLCLIESILLCLFVPVGFSVYLSVCVYVYV